MLGNNDSHAGTQASGGLQVTVVGGLEDFRPRSQAGMQASMSTCGNDRGASALIPQWDGADDDGDLMSNASQLAPPLPAEEIQATAAVATTAETATPEISLKQQAWLQRLQCPCSQRHTCILWAKSLTVFGVRNDQWYEASVKNIKEQANDVAEGVDKSTGATAKCSCREQCAQCTYRTHQS